ncbi:MAG: hypothetical protein AB8B56_13510 [Crocinitomicaceae bacterium]
MAITVNLRVVGIYFGNSLNPVQVSVDENPTVSQIMEAASQLADAGEIKNVSGLSYTPNNPSIGSSQDMSEVSVIYNDGFTSPSGTELEGGTYQLQDTSGNPYTTLQYYIFDEDFVQVNRNNEFVPFSNYPDEEIKDGYTIVWRQVSIASGPIEGAKIISRIKRSASFIANK